ncbi:Transmembrane protein 19, partial [Tetrabaena socialis]
MLLLVGAWALFVISLAGAMARRGRRKGSLSRSGAIAAFAVGAVHLGCGVQYGLTLIFFYLTSSKLTRLGARRKAQLEEGHTEGGQRSAVLANSLAACVLAALSFLAASRWGGAAAQAQRVALAGAFLGHYACCAADTWASEVGVLSRAPPRLITTGKRVPIGTNGGVTALGLGCSAAAGLAVGGTFFASGVAGCALGALTRGGSLCPRTSGGGTQMALWGPAGLAPLLAVGLVCGVFGSVLDSVLGATLQYSGWDAAAARVVARPQRPRPEGGRGHEAGGGQGYAAVVHVSGLNLLSNDGVNFLAAALSAALGAALLVRWSGAVAL